MHTIRKMSVGLLVLCLAMLSQGMSCSKLNPDGSAFNLRLMQSTEGFTLNRTKVETNETVSITLQKSNPSAEAMKAVAEGAAAGVVKGFKPVP